MAMRAFVNNGMQHVNSWLCKYQHRILITTLTHLLSKSLISLYFYNKLLMSVFGLPTYKMTQICKGLWLDAAETQT